MKCPKNCGSETRVADSRTAAKPGHSLPPYIQALLPDNRWWRWRRHHCLDCDAKTSTVEITLEHFEQLHARPETQAQGAVIDYTAALDSRVIKQMEIEMADLLVALRNLLILDGSEPPEQQNEALDRLGDLLVLHEVES